MPGRSLFEDVCREQNVSSDDFERPLGHQVLQERGHRDEPTRD